MFRKRESIEQDFMAYGDSSQQHHSHDGGFLSKLIQFLTVIILTGAVGLMGLFGYRYIQKDQQIRANEQAASGVNIPLQRASTQPAAAQAVANAPKERMYTQEEMQEIVKMLMQQIQTTPDKHVATVENAGNEKAKDLAQKEEVQTGNDADVLVAALNLADADELDDEMPAIPQDLESVENVKASEKKKVDHYNKVVVQKRKNTYDDLANLSEEIGNIVDAMSKKSKSAKYTAVIQKEVSTRKSEMRVIIVKSGDTLSKIAQRAYGNAMAYDRILKANPELINNPNNIYIGQRLRVPTDNI